MTITAPPAAHLRLQVGGTLLLFAILLPLADRRKFRGLAMVLGVICLSMLVACGGSQSPNPQGPKAYIVSVTGSFGTAQRTTTVSLMIK